MDTSIQGGLNQVAVNRQGEQEDISYEGEISHDQIDHVAVHNKPLLDSYTSSGQSAYLTSGRTVPASASPPSRTGQAHDVPYEYEQPIQGKRKVECDLDLHENKRERVQVSEQEQRHPDGALAVQTEMLPVVAANTEKPRDSVPIEPAPKTHYAVVYTSQSETRKEGMTLRYGIVDRKVVKPAQKQHNVQPIPIVTAPSGLKESIAPGSTPDEQTSSLQTSQLDARINALPLSTMTTSSQIAVHDASENKDERGLPNKKDDRLFEQRNPPQSNQHFQNRNYHGNQRGYQDRRQQGNQHPRSNGGRRDPVHHQRPYPQGPKNNGQKEFGVDGKGLPRGTRGEFAEIAETQAISTSGFENISTLPTKHDPNPAPRSGAVYDRDYRQQKPTPRDHQESGHYRDQRRLDNPRARDSHPPTIASPSLHSRPESQKMQNPGQHRNSRPRDYEKFPESRVDRGGLPHYPHNSNQDVGAFHDRRDPLDNHRRNTQHVDPTGYRPDDRHGHRDGNARHIAHPDDDRIDHRRHEDIARQNQGRSGQSNRRGGHPHDQPSRGRGDWDADNWSGPHTRERPYDQRQDSSHGRNSYRSGPEGQPRKY
eukprot:TRINITY_DN1475_c0_g1_i6.p1 TRINITY_DN1475_c0_g1~~TRINITY_DN1475_c0_g1_i6.p1  ORF type:complete len:594 (+),score=77.03 TRINITY_DN1475_c0_g1_i6:565-2346(+)